MRQQIVSTAIALAWLISGCATIDHSQSIPRVQAIPQLQGSYHHVRRGETLWRIARSYGIDADTLASVNRLPSSGQVATGQQLFIPLPHETNQFLWPIRGRLRPASFSGGIDITPETAGLVRASRSGCVAVATQRLSGWGKTIIIDHLDGYFTIYSGLEQILVVPGAVLRQGTPVGSLNVRPLHFEIRYGAVARNTLALLPDE